MSSVSIVSPKAKPAFRQRIEKLREERKQSVKKRKNFLPSLFITLALWLFVIIIILFIDPTRHGALELFFAFLFLALLFTFSLLLVNTRRGLIIAIDTVLFAVLLYLGVGTLLNLLLIIGASVMFEIYFTKRK